MGLKDEKGVVQIVLVATHALIGARAPGSLSLYDSFDPKRRRAITKYSKVDPDEMIKLDARGQTRFCNDAKGLYQSATQYAPELLRNPAEVELWIDQILQPVRNLSYYSTLNFNLVVLFFLYNFFQLIIEFRFYFF